MRALGSAGGAEPPAGRRGAPGGPGGRRGLGVLAVLGARGGAGSSTTAALLARSLAHRGPTALVDLGPPPALAVLLGAEEAPGLRWPDLAGARGHVDPEHLSRSLTRWGRCTVLSGDPARPEVPDAEVRRDVLTALAAAHPTVLVDLGRAAPPSGPVEPVPSSGRGTRPLPSACTAVLLVVPRDVLSVVAAQTVRPGLLALGRPVGLVVRGPAPGGLGAAEVARAVDLPLLGVVPASRSLPLALDRGLGPRAGRRATAAVERLADRVERWAR